MAPLAELLGQSAQMLAVREQVARFLARQGRGHRIPPVLIQGETGTGKGLLARAMHRSGPRRDGPFIDLNCAALPETLLEAELFGFERGAFTDARTAKAGLFEAADGGTIFLDEIGLLPQSLQGKLLTVIEDNSIRRLGSTRSQKVDVAIVSATSVDLPTAVRQREFRVDLYHRLAVLTISLPPLRERADDILVLAEHYLARARSDYGLPALVLSPGAREALGRHRWPGNVRELANLIERVALMAEANTITADMLELPAQIDAPSPAAADTGGRLDDTLRERLTAALRQHGGNISHTAEALGITRNTVRARMARYGLLPTPRPGRRLYTPEIALEPLPLMPSMPVPKPTAPASPIRTAEPEPSTAPEDQRHVAYLLTTVGAGADDVEAANVRRALVVIGDKIQSFGGRVEECRPTAVLGVFGLESIDNAPDIAALAALAIQTTAQRNRDMPGATAGPTIAIHAGRVNVADGDDGPSLDPGGKASAVMTLEDLIAHADPGAIVVSDAAAPFLERRFALAPPEAAGPRVHRLVRRYDAALGRVRSQFVGRESQLRQLRDTIAEIERGRGLVVAIVADPGVGKSRLVYEATCEPSEWQTLRCGAVTHGKTTSYLPFVELLKTYGKIDDSDGASEIRAKITQALLTIDNRLVDTVAPVLDLLDALPAGDGFRRLDPQQRRQQTLDAIKRVLITLAETRPICLIIEDLQWIDSESQACLDMVVDSLPSAPLALVVTYRPEYQHAWGNKSYYTQLRLNPLESEGAERLLSSLLSHHPSLLDVKRMVISRCEGNPLFIEENVRTLIETGMVAGESGDYRLGATLSPIDIPTTVQAVLEARIDRLSIEAKRLLQTAAVIGKDVPFPILQAIAELSPEALRRALATLQSAEFLYEQRRGPLLEYTFKHALTHEVAYASVRGERQLMLHARIVEAIERLYVDRLSEYVERLAHHAVRGAVWDKAVTYLRQAAAKAFARSAHRESAVFLEEACSALEHLPEARERLEQAIDIRLDLRNSLQLLGDLDKVRRYVEELEQLVHTLGELRRIGWWAAYRGHYSWITGQAVAAHEFGERATVIAEQTGDLALQVAANLYHGLACMTSGNQRRADIVLRKVIAILRGEREGERFGQVGFPAVIARAYLVFSLADRGEFDEGIALAREGMRMAYALGHPYSLGLMGSNFAWLYGVKGEFKEALTLIESADAVARQGHFVLSSPRTTWYLGHLHAAAGRLAEGAALLERALKEFEAVGMRVYLARVAADLGDAYARAGRFDEAITHAERAIKLATERGQRADVAHARRALAAVAAASGEPATAVSYYEEVIGIAEQLGLRPLQALCHLDLARVHEQRGDVMQAEEHRNFGETMCHAMDMRFWIEKHPRSD